MDPLPNKPISADHAEVRAFPPLVVLGAGLLGGATHYIFPLPVASGVTRWAVAGLVGCASLGFALWGVRHLKRAGTAVDPYATSTAVVRTGPYAFTRNPLYLSMGLLLVATGLGFNSLTIVLSTVPFFLTMHFAVVLREEAYLSRKFPEDYASYRSRVRRWL